jgi:protein-S-isoprenylcysteine O-methyltransferase Ste14
MVENVIRALIVIACAVLCFVLVVWVLGQLGLSLPPNVITILGVILILVVILYLWRTFRGSWSI